METNHCSFCRKSQDEVAQLLAFPGVPLGLSKDLFICDECVGLMMEIVAQQNDDWRKHQIERLTKL
jgi:ATP-dependent protease Clp ATPase subunit